MKTKSNLRRIAFIVMALVLFNACKQREQAPETVTRIFANHFALGQYTEAKEYATSSTIQLLEMMESLASVGFYMPDPDEAELITDDDVTCKVTGDTAICSYLEFGEPVELSLAKIEGKWLVDFNLDEFLNEDEWYEDEEDDWEFDGSEIQLN